MAELVVVGSFNAALTVYSATLPAPGETVVGSRFDQGPGGKGANQAIGPAPARALPADALALFDIITPNEGELATLAGSLGLAAGPADVLARQVVGYGVRDVVVTLGERGALWASAAGVRYFDAYPVQAVDTTGAGDAFNAGLAAALVRGEPMEAAIDQGCRAGAFCVTRNGVIDGLGYPSDLETLE